HPEDKKRYFGGYFNSVNRNKKSIAIDLKTEAGVALVKDLVADADVFIENFKRDVPHRLGLDYETLLKENPQLIYSSVSGFGD
ncbi:CoA transferase, partial [Enterococcus hirae]